jgi:hypothetical protein
MITILFPFLFASKLLHPPIDILIPEAKAKNPNNIVVKAEQRTKVFKT